MGQPERFRDNNKRLSDFYDEVWIECRQCSSKAIAKADHNAHKVKMFCLSCGYNKEVSTATTLAGKQGNLIMAAHQYFDAVLWLQLPFKNEVFFAYNGDHLNYLEQYISARLREHQNRTHFTLLEKLPKFYHEAKNRDALLKIIRLLKNKQ